MPWLTRTANKSSCGTVTRCSAVQTWVKLHSLQRGSLVKADQQDPKRFRVWRNKIRFVHSRLSFVLKFLKKCPCCTRRLGIHSQARCLGCTSPPQPCNRHTLPQDLHTSDSHRRKECRPGADISANHIIEHVVVEVKEHTVDPTRHPRHASQLSRDMQNELDVLAVEQECYELSSDMFNSKEITDFGVSKQVRSFASSCF